MNKIFKVVWSKTKECYVVVSEVAKNNGGKKKVLASVLAGLAIMGAGAQMGTPVQAGADNAGSAVNIWSEKRVDTPTPGGPGVTNANTRNTAGDNSVTIGQQLTTGTGAVAVGRLSTATGDRAVAFGEEVHAKKEDTIAIGNKNNSNTGGGIAIGKGNLADSTNNGAKTDGNRGDQNSQIAIGRDNKATHIDTTAIGREVTSSGTAAIGLGSRAEASGDYAIAIGGGSATTKIKAADYAIAIGTQAQATGVRSVAHGGGAKATAERAMALGYKADASVVDGVALGSNSKATTDKGVKGHNPAEDRDNKYGGLAGTAQTSTLAAVSVGDGATATRQITGLAAGKENTDAVNVAQLRSVNLKYAGDTGKGDVLLDDGTLTVKGEGLLSTEADATGIKLKLKEGATITDNNGKVVPPTTNGVATTDNVAQAINRSGWNVTSANNGGTTNGTTSEKVSPGDTVTFSAGKNIVLDQATKQFTYSLSSTLKDIESIQNGTTKITLNNGGGTTISGGNLSVDGNKITNVAPGTISSTSTDAVNGSQLYDVDQKFNNTVKLTGNAGATDGQALNKANGLSFGVVGANSGAYIKTSATGSDVTVDLSDDAKTKLNKTYTVSSGSFNVTVTPTTVGDNTDYKISVTGGAAASTWNIASDKVSATEGTVAAGSGAAQNIADTKTVTMQAGKNLTVNQTNDGNGNASVAFALDKDLKDLTSVTTDKVTTKEIGLQDTAGNTTTIKKDGDRITYTNDGGTTVNKVANLADEKHITKGEYDVDADGKVTMTYTDGNGTVVTGETAVIKGIAKQDLSNINNAGKNVITGLGTIVKAGDNVTVSEASDATTGQKTYTVNAVTPAVYTKADGTKVVKRPDGTYTTNVDGSAGNDVPASDVIVSFQDAAGNTTGGNSIVNNVGSAIDKTGTSTGDTFLTKLDTAATDTPNAAVNVKDLKNTSDAIIGKGLKFDANDGGEKTNKLGSKVTVKGEGTKANTEYSGTNIKTIIAQTGDDTTIDVKLAKDLTGINSISNTAAGPKMEFGGNSINITGGNLDLGSNKITNLGPATSGTDAVNYDQLKNSRTVVTSTDGSVTVTPTTSGDKTTYDLKVATTGTVAKSTWNIASDKVSATEGTVAAGSGAAQNIADTKTVTMQAGKNLTVKQTNDGNGNTDVAYSLDSDLKDLTSVTTEKVTTKEIGLKDAAGNTTTIKKDGDRITYTNDGGTTNKTVATLDDEMHIKDTTYTVDGNKKVTLTYVDGNGTDVAGKKAIIDLSGLPVGDKDTDMRIKDGNYTATNGSVTLNTVDKDGNTVAGKDVVIKGINTNNYVAGDNVTFTNNGNDANGNPIVKINAEVSTEQVVAKAGNDNLATVAPATGSTQGGKNATYEVNVDKTNLENKAEISYKANGGTAQKTTLANGFNFTSDDNSVAITTGANGKVNFKVDTTGIQGKAFNLDVDKEGTGKVENAQTAATTKSVEKGTKFVAGNNLSIRHDAINGDANYDHQVTYALNSDLQGITSITNNGGATMNFGPNEISMTGGNLNMGDHKITNVKNGTDKSDVATVGQLTKVTSNDNTVAINKTTDADGAPVYDLSVQGGGHDPRVDQLGEEIGRVGAQGAALAALKPIQYDPLEPTQIMAGYGNYRGNSAIAMGVAHYKNESTLMHAGVSWAGGSRHMMANAGVTWKVGNRDSEAAVADRYRKGPISSAYAMQQEMASVKAQNAGLKTEVSDLKAENEQMKAQIAAMMAKLGM